MRVKLKKDLTRYHPSLKVGTEGEAIGLYGKHSRQNPKAFVGVKFPQHTLDVLRSDLERVMEKREVKRGPQLAIQSDVPPKRGMVVDFGGMEFRVESIQERLGSDLWLVNLSA